MRAVWVGTGLAILLGCAVVQGRWTNRWGTSAAVQAGVARLAEVPRTVGPWQGSDVEMDARDRQAAWGAAGKWDAPKAPRLAFARQPVLYKLYVLGPAQGGGPGNDTETLKFIQELLPEVSKVLFPEG